MKDAQGFCLDDAPPASDEDGVRALRAKFFELCADHYLFATSPLTRTLCSGMAKISGS